MATLAPGSILRLLVTGEYGLVLLQVIDIFPVDLDFTELWPKKGFRIKLSDGRHSTCVSLTDEQQELVLSGKLQIGQLIYVNKIVHGAPFPCIQGPHPTPGWHPLVGTPEDLANLMSEPNLAEGKSSNLESSSNISLPDRNVKSPTPQTLSHKRASVFPDADMKVRPFICTLKKSSISSSDVAVNTSHVAHVNAVPKSLPGKLGVP